MTSAVRGTNEDLVEGDATVAADDGGQGGSDVLWTKRLDHRHLAARGLADVVAQVRHQLGVGGAGLDNAHADASRDELPVQ
jgi:hypothetical protein